MEQGNNTAALNDAAGVLPMDTGVTVNGIHDEAETTPSSSANSGAKKGRGRPPKSAGSIKASNRSDTPKRARGRPPKTGETSLSTKKVVVPEKKKVASSTHGDVSKKKRGRPSKSSTSNEKFNGISKPQVQSAPIANYQEQENDDGPTKKKRGRPSGSSPKKAVVASTSKEASPARKRGRPSGSTGIKKSAPKPKATANADGLAKKRGRPKKPAVSPTVTAVEPAPVNEPATVTPNNVQ